MSYKYTCDSLEISRERLSNRICEDVADYLGGVTDYVVRCQAQAAEKQEIIDALEAQNDALQRQVDELKQCLATYHAMSSKVMNFGGAVGTLVAHADHVTLQYQGQ